MNPARSSDSNGFSGSPKKSIIVWPTVNFFFVSLVDNCRTNSSNWDIFHSSLLTTLFFTHNNFSFYLSLFFGWYSAILRHFCFCYYLTFVCGLWRWGHESGITLEFIFVTLKWQRLQIWTNWNKEHCLAFVYF